MASLEHEAVVELLRNRPELALELLAAVRPEFADMARLGGAEASIESIDLGDAKPLERTADFVASFGAQPGGVRVIVEMQLFPDPDKRLSWPAYVAVSWARSGRRTFLVVITFDETMARWAAEPIDIGQHEFRPFVIGPSNIPLIVDRDAARRSPELAVLSVGAHRDHPDVLIIADAALAAVTELDEVRARFYSELVCHWLPDAARAILEAKMDIKREFVSELSKRLQAIGRAEGEVKGRAEGEVKGRADALLHFLAARGVAVSDADAARIRSCSDVSLLDVWIERAVRIETVEALFRSAIERP